MNSSPLGISTRIVQVCLLIVAVIALMASSKQMYLGQPSTTAQLDNIHRFMAGVYFSMGVIIGWAAFTIRQQGALVYFIAFTLLMAAIGRLVSMSLVGIPEPKSLWISYLIPELAFPLLISVAHFYSLKDLKKP